MVSVFNSMNCHMLAGLGSQDVHEIVTILTCVMHVSLMMYDHAPGAIFFFVHELSKISKITFFHHL